MPNINVNISERGKRILDLTTAYFQTSQATCVEAALESLIQSDARLRNFIEAGMKGNENATN